MARDRILRPIEILREDVRRMFRRPFIVLLALNLLLMLATTSLPEEADATAFLTWCILAALSVFVQAALTLAATEDGPHPSADRWVRAALAKKVFWRLLATELLLFLALLVSALLLVVGALFVGAALGLGMQAAVIERKGPSEALYRSVELTRADRVGFGALFAVAYLVPMAVGQASVYLTGTFALVVAINLVVTLTLTAGTLALTRAYLQLKAHAEAEEEKAGSPTA
ncbi:MAG: hypothetical protein M3516_08030 [Actinomycetota bacterium]|nr:hypothetical protein [Actinomycetota bacterium]